MAERPGGPTAADAPVGGALGGVMAALAWVPRLLLLHLAWVVLVLAGGVVGGLAPATTVLVAELRRGAAADGGAPPAGGPGLGARGRDLLRRYRRELVPANLVAGPFVLLALAAAANLALGTAGELPSWFAPVGLPAAVLLLVLGTIGAAHAVALHVLRPTAPAPLLWRGALAGAVLLPVATASWATTLLAAAAATVVIQPIGLLLGGGILVAVTTHVLTRAWQARLEQAAPSEGDAAARPALRP
ncbi:hypothetical protein V1260_05910 [Brachybacterium sp. J144]|uniref:hypothetical protein n=1 Tax=Brachybacterium sp. J144 TaxID=3116487 RepID=UPI002E79E66F|nr:hypothetical protein [Brachybacterium sp. J144]MEE1650324.1 hypothetical protein [Brachybacterium sp. J144]